MTGTDTGAELALAQVAADLIETISLARAAELAADLPRAPAKRDWRQLGPRALGMAEAANPEYREHGVTPDRPGHERHCDYCGSTRAELTEGIDGEDGAWLCKDERQCLARKAHRWPPRPDLVPAAMLSALDAEDAARLSRQQEPPESQQEPAQQPEQDQQQGWRSPDGWTVTQYGSVDPAGNWHPPLPDWHAYSHTIAGNPAHRAHLISGQPRQAHYGGPGYGGVLSGAQSASELPGAAVPPAPQDGGQAAPGAVQGAEGGDVVMGQVPGAQWMAPLPEHGARLKRPAPRSRRGRRGLRYSPGKPARKQHPGVGGSESFHGGAADAGGPDGSSTSAEV